MTGLMTKLWQRRGLVIQFGKFGLVGIVGLAVDVGVLNLVMGTTGLGPDLTRLISFMAAATTTWALNRCFTFRGQHDGTLLVQWAKFIAANAFGGLVNYGTYEVLLHTTMVVAAHPAIGVAAGSVAGMFFNFVASKKLVFRAV